MTMDVAEELPKLKSMLAMTRSKIDQWTGEVREDILRDTLIQGQTTEDQMKDLQEKAGSLRALHHELQALTKTMDSQLHEKELVSKELELTRQSVQKEQDLLAGQDKTVDEKLKELNRAVDLFRDRMALSFKKTSGNRLQMVFTNIDHKDPDSPFYFFLKVDSGKYIISDCEPAVPDLDSLVDKLNSTNNLRSFIVAMRKRFKKLAEK
ncbi:kinetochore protein Spc25-like [Babylonia areolata]|uniref:kinetochore protein Spc25-like n=1 Tax=Babylonia areolata TaxID=304850 RepID=UPI003FD282F9